tara:strand:+ start:3840 stop:3974 length:135 start_codon:yes stop_codon:yes gene_type:complete
MILELITLIIIVVTCGAIIVASWERQKLKHYYKHFNKEFGNDDE